MPAVPEVKAQPIESRFLFVDVAALRAKQLRRGARPRLAALAEPDAVPPDAPRKPERIAMEEVRQGLVHYELPGVKANEGQPS
ncbi:MAG: polymerase Rpb6 [Acidobacteria bacterium]|nr:polymerase Rpb6 [Acidobacteriota bacterium]